MWFLFFLTYFKVFIEYMMTITYFYIPSPWITTWHRPLGLTYVTPSEGKRRSGSCEYFLFDFTFSLLFIFILSPSRKGCVLNLLWNIEMNSLPRSESHCCQNISVAFSLYLFNNHVLADQWLWRQC